MAIGEYLGMMPNIVKLEPFSSLDAFGEPSFGAAQSFRARIELKGRLIRDNQGREVASRGRVFLATTAPPSTKDRLTLPAPYEPTNPLILDVRPVEDESGIHHVVLMI